jgi:CRP-like cAMP-binding protein
LFLQQNGDDMGNFFKILKTSAIFHNVNENDLPSILTSLGGKVFSYDKQTPIFIEGDQANSIGIVLSGMIHIVKDDYYGNRNIVAELSPGEFFGEVFACAGIKSMPVSVFSWEKSEVLLIDCNRLLHPCSDNYDFHNVLMNNLIKILAHKSLFLNQKIDLLSKRSTRDKILTYLWSMARQAESKEIFIPFNRQELADFLCVDRSALSAELSRMKRDGLIDFHKNKFVLL